MNWLITCPKCGGSGTVKMKASLTNINTLTSGEVWVECMNCNGKGLIVKPEDNGQTLDQLYGKIVPLNFYEAQQAELAALRQQLATARAALAWYAVAENYDLYSAVQVDHGERARLALEKMDGGE